MSVAQSAVKPARAVGSFFAMSLDAALLMFKPPFAWRELLLQSWFVARVSIVPTLMLAIPARSPASCGITTRSSPGS
jgi:phospholipid/cholesterol/gamma-HCH transport system permease protein